MLEGRIVIRSCGCWTIFGYRDPNLVLRTYGCRVHVGEALDFVTRLEYLDKVDSVSGPGEGEAYSDEAWLI